MLKFLLGVVVGVQFSDEIVDHVYKPFLRYLREV